jgi:3'(2'), 5'-bisphosphate nucleotidase
MAPDPTRHTTEPDLGEIRGALAAHLPAVVRWSGAVARRLRRYDIALSGKSSGVAATDALTLADISIQELLVAALRDGPPVLRRCRIEAEERAGDLGRFATAGEHVVAIDPIDGTRVYRDRTADDYAVMVHLRDAETVRYSLVYFPEAPAEGTWLEADERRIVVGGDDLDRPARAVLDALPAIDPALRPGSRTVYVGGFLGQDAAKARLVSAAGLEGLTEDAMDGGLYPGLAQGTLAGALLRAPNVYDFPVCVHIARLLGGDAVWVHDGRPLHFRDLWHDLRADMLRLRGIVACAVDREVLHKLVGLARDWSPDRYGEN